MGNEPYGEEALAAWEQAMGLVKEGKYEEARAVRLFKSDYLALEKQIQKRELASNAKGVSVNSSTHEK